MRWLVIVVAVSTLMACVGSESSPTPTEIMEAIELPAPSLDSDEALEAALASRRSVRTFTADPLDLNELSQLLWAAQGITSEQGARTAPSAGGLYPLELFVVAGDGLYHYLPEQHSLERLGTSDLRDLLSEAALGQEAVADGAAVFVITAVYSRTEAKYEDRAERYVHLEAGHAAENLLLQATALGLGAVPIGAFRDSEVQDVLALPADHAPLYLIPVGHPAD